MRLNSGLAAMAALAFAGAAEAQPGLSTGPDYDLIYSSDRVDDDTETEVSILRQRGVAALQAQDFTAAETAFAGLLGRSSTTRDANFLMGLAKIGLEKWDEAQTYLETAVHDEPNRPEPRTRLGLTYARLGNPDGARHQYAALTALEIACNSACPDSQWIADGLKTLDQALASETAARRVSGAALAAVAAPPTQRKTFNPDDYSLVTFTNTEDLFDLLTREGRCVRNKTAAPRQPCALILYRPADGSTDALSANFKPVFKVVNQKSIWAIHDKQLQKVRIEDLYFDNIDVIGGRKTSYISVALIGNAENRANCDAGRPCLGDLVAEDMFNMYRNMPDSVVKVIWGAGMEDPGTVRVR